MSLPGVGAVMAAIRERTCDPKAALWGEPARALEELCEDYDQAELVEAVTWAEDGWRGPLIVAQLPELVAQVRATAQWRAEEAEDRARRQLAAQERSEALVDELTPPAPTELLPATDDAQAKLARLMNLATEGEAVRQ